MPTKTKTSPLWSPMLPPERQDLDELCAVSAHGVRIRYADGSELLCGTSGLWNANLGYGNPAIARAAADALTGASYLSLHQTENIYARRAAAALLGVSGWPEHFGRVLFSTSGGAANDLVMKLSRQFHVLRGDSGRKAAAAMRGGWHGLTFGSFALTSDNLGQQMYGVDRRLVVHIQPNDLDELRSLTTKHGPKIAMVVVEPVLGTGAVPLSDAYIADLVRLRAEHGFLLVADEVATGFGRTGAYFASESWPEPPDILIASKGLTNGTSAAAAVLVSHTVADTFTEAGTVLAHAETQAGTPVTCATILATIAEMERLDAVRKAAALSDRLDAELARLMDEEALVSATTGKGCFRSIRLADLAGRPMPAAEVRAVIAAVREAGAVVHAAPDGIQLLPALIYTEAHLAELMACVRTGLAAYRRDRR